MNGFRQKETGKGRVAERFPCRGQRNVIMRSGFTLVEILVVFVVIMILVGLLFPVISNALLSAKENRARTEIFEIQKAWTLYAMSYPNVNLASFTEMDAATVQVLSGDDASRNPQQIRFMDLDPHEINNGFLDPWGNPYKLNLTAGQTVTTESVFQSRASCINEQRYKY